MDPYWNRTNVQFRPSQSRDHPLCINSHSIRSLSQASLSFRPNSSKSIPRPLRSLIHDWTTGFQSRISLLLTHQWIYPIRNRTNGVGSSRLISVFTSVSSRSYNSRFQYLSISSNSRSDCSIVEFSSIKKLCRWIAARQLPIRVAAEFNKEVRASEPFKSEVVISLISPPSTVRIVWGK